MVLCLLFASPALRVSPPVMQHLDQRSSVAPVGTSGFQGSISPKKAPPAADSSILVQGGSLRTWSYRSPSVEQVQVVLSTEGRPLDADIELIIINLSYKRHAKAHASRVQHG